MADIFPMDHSFRVLPAQNGQIAAYGNTSDENPSGAWAFFLVPSGDFTGGFAVMGRTPGISTADLTVPWIPFPYRRVCLDNVASDYALVSASLGMGGPTAIQVPANGFAIGFLIACSTGSCMIYAKKMDGATTP